MIPITVVVVSGLLVLVGGPWWVLGAGAALAVAPAAGLVVAIASVVVAIRPRRSSPSVSTSRLVRSLADDVAAGKTLRQAIAACGAPLADATVRRLCDVGAPMSAVAEAAGGALGRHAPAFRSAVALGEETGGSLVSMLHSLADRIEADEVARSERRVVTSQARFSALVVGVVPLVIAMVVVAIRGVPEPGGAVIVGPMVLGGLLMVGGAGVVAWMSRERP